MRNTSVGNLKNFKCFVFAFDHYWSPRQGARYHIIVGIIPVVPGRSSKKPASGKPSQSSVAAAGRSKVCTDPGPVQSVKSLQLFHRASLFSKIRQLQGF